MDMLVHLRSLPRRSFGTLVPGETRESEAIDRSTIFCGAENAFSRID